MLITDIITTSGALVIKNIRLVFIAFFLTPVSAQCMQKTALDIIYPVTSCSSLMQIDITDIGGNGSTIIAAQETIDKGVAVCSIQGMLAPAVHFQALLPLKTWTQRYLQIGCGGLCGSIAFISGASDGCSVLTNGGFAMAATDMGHYGQDASWGADAEKRADFAYKAQHNTSLAVRKLINNFYGQPEKYRYFNGCSDGGREGLMEAQRYPEDFDGIIAGAPAMLFQVQNTLYHGWQAVSNTDANGHTIFLSNKLALLHQAVLDKCDAIDGVQDGLIANPAACQFDPHVLECPLNTQDTSTCLTSTEVAVVQKLYAGPQDGETGEYLTAGQPLYGSELNWQGVFVSDSADQPLMSSMFALPVLQYLAFPQVNPNFTLNDLEFTKKTLDALRLRHKLFDATNTKIDLFAQMGHKLILWHGLADAQISPANTVYYHKQLVQHMGPEQINVFERLYLLPGVSHCGGGQGPDKMDLLSAMIAWVEEGIAPYAILTAKTDNPLPPMPPHLNQGPSTQQKMTRPVYPYPYTAQYTGEGSIYDAENWKKGLPEESVFTRRWPGANLFSYYDFSNE